MMSLKKLDLNPLGIAEKGGVETARTQFLKIFTKKKKLLSSEVDVRLYDFLL